MKNNRVYPSIFYKEEDGYNVYFPDFEGAFTCGNTFEEALYMAKDCLELVLSTYDEMPVVNDITAINLKKGEYIVMIQADMLSFRKKHYSQPVKKTLTIPKWLNDLAIEREINFSQLLQKALKDELNIK